jgi:Uma2 family endonuclease
MAARIEPLMTVDDLDAMPEDGNRYEVIEGELFVSCAPGLSHQRVFGNIFKAFVNYLESNQLGEIIATPGLVFDQYSGVIPDVVFFTHRRGAEIIAKERLIAAPELVIEILSPGSENLARDRVAKRQLYAKHSVKEYWIVDSANRAVEVYRLQNVMLELVVILRGDEELTSPLLPDFKCAVAGFFGN